MEREDRSTAVENQSCAGIFHHTNFRIPSQVSHKCKGISSTKKSQKVILEKSIDCAKTRLALACRCCTLPTSFGPTKDGVQTRASTAQMTATMKPIKTMLKSISLHLASPTLHSFRLPSNTLCGVLYSKAPNHE